MPWFGWLVAPTPGTVYGYACQNGTNQGDTMRTITRTTNPNGTYRYEIDGAVIYKASKVLYTHASSYTVGTENDPILFHKTESAANKATGYRNNGWVKTGVLVIEDGDAAAPAPAVDEPAADTRCVTCVAHPGWAHANQAQRREPQDICGDCLGSGLESVAKTRRAPAVEPTDIELWETYQGQTHAYDNAGNRVIEISERVRASAWNTATNVRSWTVLGDGITRHGVIARGTADGLRAAKKAALAAFREISAQPAPEPLKVPNVRAKVRVNSSYPTRTWEGRGGTVKSKAVGDDGKLYVTVDLNNGVTWPFLVHELDLV